MEKRKYDSTVARIAGNILSGQGKLPYLNDEDLERVADQAVRLARAIVAKTIASEPTT